MYFKSNIWIKISIFGIIETEAIFVHFLNVPLAQCHSHLLFRKVITSLSVSCTVVKIVTSFPYVHLWNFIFFQYNPSYFDIQKEYTTVDI